MHAHATLVNEVGPWLVGGGHVGSRYALSFMGGRPLFIYKGLGIMARVGASNQRVAPGACPPSITRVLNK